MLDEQREEASRFFYCPKANKKERNQGLEEFEGKQRYQQGNYSQSPICSVCSKTFNGINDHSKCGENTMVYDSQQKNKQIKNHHPTCKPVKLIQYLTRLITPKGGIVLDPFIGSGTTGIACKYEGFNFIGIELEKEYYDIAEARINSVDTGLF